MKDDDRTINTYDGQEFRTPSMFQKVILFVLLILSTYLIYKYYDDRNKAAEEIVENGIQKDQVKENDDYIWKYKNMPNAAGEYYIKEKGLFGEVITIPIHHTIIVDAYCYDAAKVEMRFEYELDDDMTIDELLYYQNNKEYIEQEFKVKLRKTLVNYSVIDLFEGNAKRNIAETAYMFGEQNKLDVVFTTFTPEPSVANALEKRRQAQIELENFGN